MFEDFINALRNFKVNKMRTLLSLLGIVIGVMAVVIVTTLGNSLDATVRKIFSRFTMDVLYLERWQVDENKLPFNEEFRTDLMRNVSGIKNVFYYSFLSGTMSRADTASSEQGGSIIACEYGAIEANGYEIDYGESFLPFDFVNGSHKIILGKNIAESLFPEGSAVGKQLTVYTQKAQFTLTVAGVLKHKDAWSYSPDRAAYIPFSFVTKKINPRPEIGRVDVQLYNENDAENVSRQIGNYADKKTDTHNSLWVSSAKTQMQENNKIFGVIGVVLTSIAGISLLVGGIGIMNIMIVTVTERRHEIGMRKALGASNADIRNQFLVESATITFSGGLLGVVLGMLISALVGAVAFPKDWDFVFAFNFGGTVAAFAVSVFTGIFFGLNPALKAARMDPIEALND